MIDNHWFLEEHTTFVTSNVIWIVQHPCGGGTSCRWIQEFIYIICMPFAGHLWALTCYRRVWALIITNITVLSLSQIITTRPLLYTFVLYNFPTFKLNNSTTKNSQNPPTPSICLYFKVFRNGENFLRLRLQRSETNETGNFLQQEQS